MFLCGAVFLSEGALRSQGANLTTLGTKTACKVVSRARETVAFVARERPRFGFVVPHTIDLDGCLRPLLGVLPDIFVTPDVQVFKLSTAARFGPGLLWIIPYQAEPIVASKVPRNKKGSTGSDSGRSSGLNSSGRSSGSDRGAAADSTKGSDAESLV